MRTKALNPLPILLVDDESQILHSASLALRGAGHAEVLTLDDSRAVLPLLAERRVGVIVLDLTMPHLSGLALLAVIAVEYPEIEVIVMTATNDLPTAVQCMREGASDYLLKPVERSCLLAAVRRAVEARLLRAELLSLKDCLLSNHPHQPGRFEEIVTQSPAMFAIFRYIEAVAASPQPVLISGETGTGKELIARALHRQSGRPGDLVAVNVAGLDDNLFADTLFGHAKGSFTGADRARDGLIASTGDGTLFLDEIGDLSIASQVKLLRLLQDGSYYPIGTDRPRQSRARIVVATHCDVKRQAELGGFRKDLYFRLRTHHIQLPPLRERREDLPQLALHLVEKAAASLGRPAPNVPPALFQWLDNYRFPGNIRELEGLMFDAVARSQGSVLSLQSLKDAIAGEAFGEREGETGWRFAAPAAEFPERLPTLKEAEEALIGEALRRAQGNQGVAAGLLGISRQALNKRLIWRDADGF